MILKTLKQVIVEKYGSAAEFSMHVLEDESAVSRIINGRRGLSVDRQNVWAKMLKCPRTQLFPKQKDKRR